MSGEMTEDQLDADARVEASYADPADCPDCGEWRDNPHADCANCGYEPDGRSPDQIDDDLDAMAPGNFM